MTITKKPITSKAREKMLADRINELIPPLYATTDSNGFGVLVYPTYEDYRDSEDWGDWVMSVGAHDKRVVDILDGDFYQDSFDQLSRENKAKLWDIVEDFLRANREVEEEE